jgi:hypothetical protein
MLECLSLSVIAIFEDQVGAPYKTPLLGFAPGLALKCYIVCHFYLFYYLKARFKPLKRLHYWGTFQALPSNVRVSVSNTLIFEGKAGNLMGLYS